MENTKKTRFDELTLGDIDRASEGVLIMNAKAVIIELIFRKKYEDITAISHFIGTLMLEELKEARK
jgi:hypothetical protein